MRWNDEKKIVESISDTTLYISHVGHDDGFGRGE